MPLDTRSRVDPLPWSGYGRREGLSGDLAGEPTPLLLREPTPHAVPLPVLERPREAFAPDRAGAAERERGPRFLLRDREEDVGVDPEARGPFLPDVGR